MSEHFDGMSEHNDLLPLRSPEEAAPAFELVRRGYDRDQVDNHLGWLEDQLRNAEIARDAAEHAAASAAAEAESARDELERGRPQWHEFGDRITEILNLAEDQGAQIRAQRSQEADELLTEARQLSADTERTCAIQMRDSEATSQQLVADAQAQSKQLLTDAESQAQEIVTGAQTEADRLMMRTQQETAELERQSSRRLAELERQRDAVNAQLTRMREALENALTPAISIEEPTAAAEVSLSDEGADYEDSEYDDTYAAAPAAPASADVRRR